MDIIILNASTSYGLRTIGAYRTATELRKYGFTVKVIEYADYITIDGIELLKNILNKFITSSTLWVGISSTWMWKSRDMVSGKLKKATADFPNLPTASLDINYDEASELREYIKSISPNCKIVCGGVRAPIMPHKNLYDVYMYGYSEIHAVDFTKWLQGKNPFFSYKTIDEKMVLNYNIKADGFDFFSSETDWSKEHIFPGEALPIEIARGCIFKCKFCSFMLNGKKQMDYVRDPEKIYDEIIKNYEMYGVTDYALSDDTYNDSTEKLELLYNKVWSRLPFKASFSCYLRLDILATKTEQISLLKESGLLSAFFGIESLNNATNKAIGKGITESRLIDSLYKCRELWGDEISTSAGFIIGLPNDTEETCRHWLEKIVNSDFPLHTKIIYPLYIGNQKQRIWHSDFEKDPEKYGYEIILDTGKHPGWINHKTGLDTQKARKLSEEYFLKLSKQRPVAFANTALKSFGYTDNEIIVYKEILEEDPIFIQKFKNRRQDYWSKLLKE